MQPTATASIPPPADMDMQTMQSMDWLFKKERIYLLAQFWQQRATLAEKEVTTLKEQLGTTNTTPSEHSIKSESNMDRHGYESELAIKDKENTQLLEEIQRLQVSLTKIQESSMSQITRLEEQLDQKRQHINRLEFKLDNQRDYEELKREISLLRSAEFSSNNPDTKPSLDILLERSKSAHSDRPKSPEEDIEDSAEHYQQHKSSTESLEDDRLYLGAESNNLADHSSHTPPPPPQPTTTTLLDTPNTSLIKSTASSPQPHDIPTSSPSTPPLPITPQQHHHLNHLNHAHLLSHHNGLPKSPTSTNTTTTEDNNNHHLNNNNHLAPQFAAAAAAAAALNINFLRSDDLKSPFRFDTGDSQSQNPPHHRSPFRFAEDLGMAPGSMVGRLGESLIPKGDPMEAKLQEMLRYNMDKYASQNLDTLHISRRVRELLSIHNIGQRLFAKYILGLSQGTVSELLSKPKPWDKLTEKGRDSYRKMHAWACDDNAIMLLKSLIPKKDHLSSGKESGGLPSFGRGPPEGPVNMPGDMTEERIAHILTEAGHLHLKTAGAQQQQHMLHMDDSQHSHNEDSKSPHEGQCTSPFSKDSTSQSRRLKKYENDDIPQEKVMRIYNEELSKLMGKRIEDFRNPREAFQNMFFPQLFSGAAAAAGGGAGQMDRTQEEIRMALDAYHREIMKINQVQGGGIHPGQMPNIGLLALHQQALAQHNSIALGNGIVQDLSIPKEKLKQLVANGLIPPDEKDKENTDSSDARHSGSAFSLVRPKIEPGSTPTQTTTSSSTASSPLGNTILPPAMTPTDEFSANTIASPLQRMASITNSLISQPTSQPHHTSSQRPLKAVLPPITQQQFDLYNNLNTEDIVKKVKEQLSQYSISQRLFGESVLGLSQGSVSDLLARPKPWHMLTQKGREPFIRMKMFLEDDNAVHKLVASQYKIAPEKLMRTGGYGGTACNAAAAAAVLGNNAAAAAAVAAMQQQQQQQQQQTPSSNPTIPTSKQPLPPTPKMLSEAAGLFSKLQQDSVIGLLPPSLQSTTNSSHSSGQPPGAPPMLLTPPGVPPHHAINLQQSNSVEMHHHAMQQQQQQQVMKKAASASASNNGSNGSPHGSAVLHSPMAAREAVSGVNQQQQQQQQSAAMRSLHQHISPSVYEMAALTQDLDTQTITTKIKEALLANNIGQKIFGEAVLGLSQGSVSELLSKPKPWHMLSIKGREPFIRMQLWLNDAHNVDRLQALKNERREANKRRRSSGAGAAGTHDNSSDTSSNDTSEFYHSNSPGPHNHSMHHHHHPHHHSSQHQAKKQRVLFSEEQKEALRLAFALDPYPNVATIEFLAQELGLSSRTITNWFHNHRMRLKQQVPHGIPAELPARDQTGSQTPFDPVQFRLLLNQRLLDLSKDRMLSGSVPIPYPPYLATNPNLAALITRGLLPNSADLDLCALGNAVKEQISGLDLSMTSNSNNLKREPDEFDDDDDAESNMGSEDSSTMSHNLKSHHHHHQSYDQQQLQLQTHDLSTRTSGNSSNQARSSRRKPAAPQWVNPDWQDEKTTAAATATATSTNPTAKVNPADEVIINGVCVMQTEDLKEREELTVVRVEPTDVLDRFELLDDGEELEEERKDSDDEEQNSASSVASDSPVAVQAQRQRAVSDSGKEVERDEDDVVMMMEQRQHERSGSSELKMDEECEEEEERQVEQQQWEQY